MRHHQAVEAENHDGADDGHDEPGRFTLAIEAHHSPDPAAQHGTHDAEDDREEDASRVVAGHEKLRYDSYDETEHDPQQDVHRALLSPDACTATPRVIDRSAQQMPRSLFVETTPSARSSGKRRGSRRRP